MIGMRPAVRVRLRRWLARYGPLEIAGTVTALLAAWAAHALTGQLAASAVAGTLGENVGYYGVAGFREARRHWRLREPGARSVAHAAAIGWRTVRSLVLEFGPAELLDSAWIRPGLMFAMSRSIDNVAVGVLAGKLMADAIFYGVAIVGYELHQRRRAAAALSEVNPT